MTGVISSRGESIAGWGFIFVTQALLKAVYPCTSSKVAMERIM